MLNRNLARRIALPAILLLQALHAPAAFAQAHPSPKSSPEATLMRPHSTAAAPTVEEARAFIEAAEKRLLDLGTAAQRANWVQENFITDDTEIIAAEANKELDATTTELVAQSLRFAHLKLPSDVARKFPREFSSRRLRRKSRCW